MHSPLPSRRARVVVAEDDPALRALLVDSLRACGYEVAECSNGLELCESLDACLRGPGGERSDAVVTDVRMPGWDGLEILEGVRHIDAELPFVVITAFGDAETHARAHALGAEIVLDKPVDIEDVVNAVRAVIVRSNSS